MKTTINYAVLRPKLDTGDNILFRGRGLKSFIIRNMTFGYWSHMGKVIREGENVYAWESTKIGRKVHGVQISLLSVRVAQYKGRVAVRRLLDVERDARMRRVTKQLKREMKGKAYEKSVWQLLGAALPWRNERDLTSMFCSELCAEWDIRNGILPSGTPSNEYHPNDYGKGREVDKVMLRGRLGNVIFLKR